MTEALEASRSEAFEELQRAAEERRLNEARLSTLVELSRMTDEPVQRLTEFALESAVALTGSSIGYLSFTNDDESVLTMYSWSRTAMAECLIGDKPIVYPVVETGLWGEAVRQRRPIITNDYAAPSPYKKGYPEGHVPVHRHMNVPLFDGDHIVLVAGVGNKPEPYDESDVRQLTLLMDGMWKILLRKRAEESLRQKTEELDRYFANSADMLCIADTDGSFRRLNPAWTAALGYDVSELEGRQFLDFVHPEDREATLAAVARLAEGRTVIDFVNRYRCRDGSYRQIEWRSFPSDTTIYAVARDITARLQAEAERRHLEAQLQQTQKLESLGVLAGGIAHDFNNILVAILGHAELAQLELSTDHPALESLQQIEVASQRAAELCRQMLAYSGKGHFVVRPLDLNALVRSMAALLEVSISKKAELRLDLAPDLPAVEGDVAQIQQVLMNLVINASEALEERTGTIRITTVAREDPPRGRSVVVDVSDTGCGMAPETRARVFEPFFTTKFTGRGLGLAAVLGIVRGHGGAIEVSSAPGAGSTFSVVLPGSERPASGLDQLGPSSAAAKGSGLVLFVDDEGPVREVGRKALEIQGYGVLTASDGVEALELLAERAGELVCVVLDLTMPRMDGEETFRALRRLAPEVPVLLSSGYSEQEAVRRFGREGPAAFIQKPYRIRELEEKLLALVQRSRA